MFLYTLFSNAYILGGSPCSGKSTMAEMLAAEFKLPYYKVDDYEQDHIARAILRQAQYPEVNNEAQYPEMDNEAKFSSMDNKVQYPVMANFTKMGWNEIWSRPVAVQVAEELAFYRERFRFMLEDLEAFDPQRPLILECAAFLPELINRYEPNRSRVLYMMPTQAFQLHHYQKRPWIKDILAACDDPDQAFDNWMMRDHLFGQEILRQAQVHKYETMIVDGSQSMEAQFVALKSHLRIR